LSPGSAAAIGCCRTGWANAAHPPRSARAAIVSFVAGQCKGLSEQDWTGLAGKGRTLVIYMGLATADAIAEKLIADGASPPDVPVAVVENGTTRSTMRVLRSPPGRAGRAGRASQRQASPALIVDRRRSRLNRRDSTASARQVACAGGILQ
jgi:uroporphyrin-III C-methyltransferase